MLFCDTSKSGKHAGTEQDNQNQCRHLLTITNTGSNSHILVLIHVNSNSTGCPTKNYTLFWRAVASLNFELGIKVGGVLESSGSQLFKTVLTFDFWPRKAEVKDTK